MALVKGQSVFVPQAGAKEKYRLGKDFERSLVVTMCSAPVLYARVGHAMHTEGFEEAEARLLFSAIRSVADGMNGSGPSSRSTVIARIRQWVTEGKYDVATLRQTLRFIERAEDAGMPPVDEIASAVSVQLQRLETRLTLESAMTTFQKREDLQPVVERLERAQRIGVVEQAGGTLLGPVSFDRMRRSRSVVKLESGIMELDQSLEGGFDRGSATVFLGGSSSGKSQVLVQIATASALREMTVALATLENDEDQTFFRLKSNFTGVPVNDMRRDDTEGTAAFDKAEDRVRNIMANPHYGGILVGYFPPLSTTLEDVLAWVEDNEKRLNRTIDVVVIDYADKLGGRKIRAEESTYGASRIIYDMMRAWAVEKKKWVFTASQAQRKKDRKSKAMLDLDDVADSMHKIRTADYVISLNLDGETGEMKFFNAKVRGGRARAVIGGIYPLFECARIAPINWPESYHPDGVSRVFRRVKNGGAPCAPGS